MPIRLGAATFTILALAWPAVQGAETGLILNLQSGTGDFEQRISRYDCGAEDVLEVRYLNAAPNFLAIVPVEGETQPLIFASVISGSGVRYASGQWVWWTKGSEASLYDETAGEDAEPVLTCSEVVNTP